MASELMVLPPAGGDLVVTPHPLTLQGQRVMRGAELRPGDTLVMFLQRSGVDLAEGGWVVSIGGAHVPELMWARTRPRHGHLVECRRVVGRDTVRAIAQIAIAVAAFYFSGGNPFVAFAINTVGNLVLNKLLPPPRVQLPNYSYATGSTYDLQGGRNRARPFEPLGIVFGVVKVVPDYATQPYSWFEGDDQIQYVRLHGGINCGSVASIQIGATDIGTYQGVSVTQSGFPGMSTQLEDWSSVDTIAGAVLTFGEEDTVRTSSASSIRLALDLQAQLYDMADDGSMNTATVEFTAYKRLLPSGDWTPFESSGPSYTMSSRSTAPARLTVLSDVVDTGQYEVKLAKVTEDVSTTRANNTLTWSTLKSYQQDNADYTSYPQVGIRIKASGQLNGALDEVNWIATSQPTAVWNGSAWVTQSTRNPGAHILQVARGIYDSDGKLMAGMGLPDSQIDISGLQDFMVQCATKGYLFDHWFDRPVSCGEMLEAMAATGLATISYHTGKLGVVWLDSGQPLEAVVNMGNIKRGTFRVDYATRDTDDEIEVSWPDRDNGWLPQSLRVTAPGVTIPRDTARIAPAGVTTQTGALLMDRLAMAQNIYQRKAVSWEMDLEHITFRRYSVIAASHDMTQWGYGGRLHSAAAPGGVVTLVLDAEVPWNPGATLRKVGVRVPGEQGYRIFGVAAFSGTVDALTLTDAWPSGVPFPGDSADNPAHDYLWIYDFQASPGKRLRVTSIEPYAGLQGAKITAVPEEDAFWTFVNSGAYTVPGSAALRQTVMLSNPTVTQRRLGLTVDAGVELALTFEVVGPYDHAQVWAAPAGSALKFLGETRTASFAGWQVTEGGSVNLQVRAFDSLGRAAPVLDVPYTVVLVDPLDGSVQGLGIQRAFPGGIQIGWTADTRSDVRTELRLGGASWDEGTVLYSGNSDTYPYMWPGDGYYVIRARLRNAWGQYSETDSTVEFWIVDGVITGDYVTDPQAGEWARSDGSVTVWQRSIIDPESGQVVGYEDVAWAVTATLDTNLPVAVDFNARNDRDGTTPLAPTVAVDGTAVDHVVKADGSADVSFEWGWAGDEANIDGFEVMLYSAGSSGAYAVGTNPGGERVSFVPAYKRAMLAYGLNGSSYLTWAVRAFRVVDPDIDASGVLYSAWVQPTAAGEAPYQPVANVAFSGDLTGTISGIPVSNAATWQSTSTNFNARNDRLSGTPAAPTTATDGTAVDHVINGNGSADVSFEWAWSGDESTIDGFEVLLYLSSSSGVYTIGSNAAAEQVLDVPANKRAILAYGISPTAYETWAVRAYRVVDPDVNAAGVLRSAWVRPGGTGEDPYRAASAVAFTGDLTGTISGIAASNASTWQTVSTNFNSRNDRLSGTPAVPTTATDGTCVDHVINGNGSADVSFEWAWSGDESTIDGFEVLLYLATSSGAYTIGSNAAAEQVLAVPANKRAILVYGVSPTAYETWAVRAYRVVDPDVNSAGVLRSAWVRPAGSGEDPYRPASSVAFTGDVTGTVGGIPAANVNQWSAISGINVVTSQIDPGAVTGSFERDSGAPTFSFAYGGTWNHVLYDPLSYTPSVNCTVDITIRLSCDAGVGWGGGSLAMAGAVPDSLTYTVRNDIGAHDPIYSFPAYTGWSDGYAVADTSHFHDWSAYVGAVAQFPPDRAGITLFASLALTAGTTYRIGLVGITGEDGGTVYEYQTSVVVRKR